MSSVILPHRHNFHHGLWCRTSGMKCFSLLLLLFPFLVFGMCVIVVQIMVVWLKERAKWLRCGVFPSPTMIHAMHLCFINAFVGANFILVIVWIAYVRHLCLDWYSHISSTSKHRCSKTIACFIICFLFRDRRRSR